MLTPRLRKRPKTAEKHRARRVRDEASNSFALFIIMSPVIFGAFGVGLDISRNVFIRTELQNALDLATVGGAAVTTVNPDGNIRITDISALDAVEKLYAINRVTGPKLSCWGDRHDIPNTDLDRCWRVNAKTVNNQYLSYSLQERSQNAFLTVIGVKWQEYNITSQARIKQDAE